MPRERKRKICSCCESPVPKMTSRPDVKKRRHVQKQNKVRSNPQPVIEPVKRTVVASVVPVNHSKSVTMSKVLACEVEEMNQDIVYESTGHSTRRIKRRVRRTVRGFSASYTFIKEVTYTYASKKVGYIGQELLPFHVRPDWLNRSQSAQEMPATSNANNKSADSRSDAFGTPSDFPNTESDKSHQAFYRSEDSDSSSSDSDSEYDQDTKNLYRHMTSGRDTRNANNSDGFTSDSSDSASEVDANNCGTESGKKCGKHSSREWCFCFWSPCRSERRPLPETCPREMKELVEAFVTGSTDKQEYALMKEVKYGDLGCSPCIYLYNNEQMTLCNRQLRNLRVDRTFNLGACYVTAFVYRNSNLILKSSTEDTYGPLMTGPVMLHFDTAFDTYVRFFQTVREKAGILTKPMSDRQQVDNMRNMPRKDKLITKPMRNVFGSSLKLASIHHVPVSLRNDLRRKVSCFEPISFAVKAVYDILRLERMETQGALVRNSEWSLHPRTVEYMKKWEYASLAQKLQAFDRLVAV